MRTRQGSEQIQRGTALAMATVSQSLRFQSPSAWKVLENMGFTITFAASPDEWSRDFMEADSFEAIRVGRNILSLKIVSGLLDVRRLLKGDWTLVQVQSPVIAALARLVPNHSTLIYIAHGFHFHADGSLRGNLAFSLLERTLAGRCKGLGVVSAEDFDMARRLGFQRRTCLWRLPGAGVDLHRFPLAPRRDAESIRILFIGELNENKDPVLFIDVLHWLRSQGIDAAGTIVGDGPLREVVRSAASEKSACLTWIPHTGTPEEVLRQSDVLLLPSRREGLPRVVIESLATGRPVVARSNRGSRELLTTPEHGRLMAPEASVESWALAVLSSKAGRDAGAALRESMHPYSVDAFMASYRNFVERVLTHADPRGAFDLNAQERLRVDDR
jgi:glycosyltransferase involved in cell wall biosynthesis